MTQDVVTVRPEDNLDAVVQMFFRYKFDGLPVVDQAGNLAGLITEYDLVTKSSGLHLPTIATVFKNLDTLKRDVEPLRKSFHDILKLTARDVMNTEPMTLSSDTGLVEAAKVFVEHHRVNPIPVLEGKKLVGILSRYDVIRLFEFQHLGAAVTAAHDAARKRADRGAEEATGELMKAIKGTVVVSKWRSRFWYIFAGLFFIAGFIVAMSWVIRITIRK